jgi:hypothetical protein
METAQPQAEKKRRPSIGQKFEQMIAEKKKQEQEEEQKQRCADSFWTWVCMYVCYARSRRDCWMFAHGIAGSGA